MVNNTRRKLTRQGGEQRFALPANVNIQSSPNIIPETVQVYESAEPIIYAKNLYKAGNIKASPFSAVEHAHYAGRSKSPLAGATSQQASTITSKNKRVIAGGRRRRTARRKTRKSPHRK